MSYTYFLVTKVPEQRAFSDIPDSAYRRAHWLVDFRSANHVNIFNGQQWHSKRAALHAIALIDPRSIHPVVTR